MTTRQGRPRTRVAVFACVSAIALVVDQVSKIWAQHALSDGRTVEIVPHLLSLTLVRNPGASLGFGSSMTWMIALLAIVACIALAVMAVRTVSMRWTLMLSLAFAGALGNLIDRVVYADGFLNGKVVDFLNYGWSVGNVADIWLMLAGIGIVILIIAGTPFGREGSGSMPDSVGSQDATMRTTMPVGEQTDTVTVHGDDGRDASQGGESL